jgi:hypothetical protein
MSATSTVLKPPVMTKHSTLRHRAANSSPEAIVTDEGRKTDKFLDSHTR